MLLLHIEEFLNFSIRPSKEFSHQKNRQNFIVVVKYEKMFGNKLGRMAEMKKITMCVAYFKASNKYYIFNSRLIGMLFVLNCK